MRNKVIITCAVTGSIHTPTMSPHLPVSAEAIAAQSIEAARAGAAIIHLHARRPDSGCPSPDPDDFLAFLPAIRDACDAVLNITTGGSSLMNVDDRLAAARRVSPEMCSLNMGSMNFGVFPLKERYDHWQHAWEPGLLEATRRTVFRNTFEDIERAIEELGRGHGTRFEFECYDVGHIETLAYYLRRGLVEPPLYVQFVLGVFGGSGATADNLVHMKSTADRLLGDGYRFSALGAGVSQMKMATLGAILGGNVRVGLEDNLSMPDGELAPDNAAQVTRIRGIVEALGYEIATPADTRRLLALKGPDAVNF